jgi:hypothetical protein
MALGSTQPLTEMSTRNLLGGKGRGARKADNFTAICEPRCLTTLLASTTCCYRDSFTLFYTIVSIARLPLEQRFVSEINEHACHSGQTV